ncbi:SDR family NAD(P)-dependent oxidoreductase [Bradyrhizobium tropiciagri]|uniref:SDR family NAD(P)-dependent oxidoreductase n=1 Tax=Bradyrhizobium tropiciagri TaxID=312253 RepID=UPI000A8F476D|nr:SDR family NAD(P)-dependent oxidoreductase [Bradyrhizobium tropiciagri]
MRKLWPKPSRTLLRPRAGSKRDDGRHRRSGHREIIINNAGVTATRPALQQDEADWEKVVDINLKGVWLVGR